MFVRMFVNMGVDMSVNMFSSSKLYMSVNMVVQIA